MPVLSVVSSVYNERENLEALLGRLLPILERLSGGSFEVIFVDDGSTDGSSGMLDEFHSRDARVKALHLSRNFGHQSALQAGLDQAAGDAVILMDSDLQDPPEILEQFVQRWREGYEIVYAVRRKRKEGLFLRAAYSLFYKTLRSMAEIEVPPDAGDFCLMDRRVVDNLVALRERNRFLRGLRSWIGFRQVGIDYERDRRHGGEPKYTLRKLTHLALSGYVGFSTAPLRLAIWLGFLASSLGFALALWAVATRIFSIPSPQGWASTLSVVLFVGGVQLLMLGVIGEYVSRIYDEVRQRPLYIVRSRTGFGPPEQVHPAAHGRASREGLS